MAAPLTTRAQLAERVAIERALYEQDVLSHGYSEAAFESMIPFAKGVIRRHLRGGGRVAGCSYFRSEYGDTYTMNVDYPKLVTAVERQLPRWRLAVAEKAAV